MSRCAFIAWLLLGAAAPVQGQLVTIRDSGPGPAGRLLASALAGVHRVVAGGPDELLLPRDSVYPVTLVVLGRDVAVQGKVRGDIIVVDGNLFIRPGGQVDGRGIAIGGGAYPSMLGTARGGLTGFIDVGFQITAADGAFVLDYRVLRQYPSPPLSFPGLFGLRIPSYDRSDGLSLPYAPALSVDTERAVVEPTLTYRSQLGTFDLSLSARMQAGRRFHVDAFGGRGTFTNDGWIWSDLVNAGEVFLTGTDSRNYFRADRAEVTAHELVETPDAEFEPYVGMRTESARSVRPDSGAGGGPWSLFGRRDAGHMLRPNPRVDDGHLTSVLVGGRLDWLLQGVQTTLQLDAEQALAAPRSRRFTQTVFAGHVGFPTFGNQQFGFDAHLLLTAGDTAPRQRWGYLGGAGTFPILPLLSRGGDQLVYFESNYLIPVNRIDLPLIGAPTVTLRDVLGSAGPRHLPPFEQNIGARIALSIVRVEYLVDPVRRVTHFALGLSLTR